MDQQKPPKGRVTLHDVARAAGVSKSSVSRMLDERLPRSDSEKARHVRKIAAELGYVRDVAAASLRRGSTGMLGVIVSRLTDTVVAMLYELLARAAAKAGQFTIVATTEDEPDAERRAADMLLRRGADGLILATAREGDTFTDELAERGVPFVLVLRRDGASRASIGDDPLGGYLAARHLLDLGHRDIALLAGPEYALNARDRTAGFHTALAEAGIEARPDRIIHSAFGIEAGAAAMERLLASGERPSAIFAVNDNIAIGALSAMARKGISVPNDMSLVGYNDIPLVAHLPVPLTSVRVPFDQVASSALELLAAETVAERDRVRIATPTLIPRRSAVPHR